MKPTSGAGCDGVTFPSPKYPKMHPVDSLIGNNLQCIGVTINFSLQPEHLFKWPDGSIGLIYGFRSLRPDAFDADGWPLHPVTKRPLEINAIP